MPEKKRGIAFQSGFSKISLQEGVVAGIGVLLFFLGLWSGAILTKIFCFVITGIAAYYVIDSLRGKKNGKSDDDDAVTDEPVGEDEKSFMPLTAGLNDQKVEGEDDEGKSDVIPSFVMVEQRAEVEEKKILFEEPVQRAREAIIYSPSDFVDDGQSMVEGSQQEPKTEFNFLLQKMLSVIKEVVFANSVSFFWVNDMASQRFNTRSNPTIPCRACPNPWAT